MNLMSEPHHECEKRVPYFVFCEYLSIIMSEKT